MSNNFVNNLIVNESGTATHIENFKIVILGDQNVGKTSVLHKYKYETVEENLGVSIL
jgi:GTPase SAR1 family protein